PIGLLLRREQSTRPQHIFAEVLRQRIAHVVEVIRSIADAKLRNRRCAHTASGEILPRPRSLRRLQRRLKVLCRGLVNITQPPPPPLLRLSPRPSELALRQ